MQALTRAAKLALRQVRLVVVADFCRDNGDVITPSGKNLADDGISALGHASCRSRGEPWEWRSGAETTIEPRAAVHAEPRASNDCATNCAARRARAPPSSARFRDG